MRKLALAVLAAVAVTAVPAAAKPGHSWEVLGIQWAGRSTSLAVLDGVSLRPKLRPIRLGAPAWVLARSGNRVAVAVGEDSKALRLVDVKRRRASKLQWFRGSVAAAMWPDPALLVVVTHASAPAVEVVDARTLRVLAHRPFSGSVTAIAHGGNRLVMLLASDGAIGETRLAVVESDGTVRTAPLPGIRSVFEVIDAERHISRIARPGLAVDTNGARAVAVTAGGAIADVDLESLHVRTQALRRRSLAKASEGAVRTAAWAGPHTLAVTGTDMSVDGDTMRSSAAGLTLIDVRDWSARVVDAHATSATVVGTTVLAHGDNGLAGYTTTGARKFRLFDEMKPFDLQVASGHVYASWDNGRVFRIVDHELGAPFGNAATTRLPTFLYDR